MKKDNEKNTIYTLVVVMLPILSIYKSPLYNIDLASFLLVVSFSYTVIKRKRITLAFPKEWTIYLLYVLFSVILFYSFATRNQEFSYVILRTIKYLVYMIIGVYSAYTGIFNYKIGLKMYKKISLISITFLYLQVFFYSLFGIVVNGVFENLLLLDSYATRFRSLTGLSRPTSFFLEPSHFFDYTMFFLIYSIFRNNNSKLKDFYLAIFISIGMVLSTSGQAMLFVIAIWILFFITQIKSLKKSNLLLVFSLSVAFPILFITFKDSLFIQDILTRIFNPNAIGGNAVDARAIGYSLYEKLNNVEKLFGTGYGNTPNVFFSSMSFNLYTLGILGTLLVLYIFLKSYNSIKVNHLKILIVSLLGVSLGNTTFMSVSAVFFFSFIYSNIYYTTKEIKLK